MRDWLAMHKECRQQAQIDAPVPRVWDLVADPKQQEQWWPTLVDADCDEFTEGCRYRAVVKSPTGREQEHHFVIERLDDCREVLIRCEDVGTYTRFLLLEAQGGTFVDARFGIEPQNARSSAIALIAGRRILRRWLSETMDALERAAEQRAAAGGMSSN